MAIITVPAINSPHPHLRRFNPLRDLGPVADLIEQCFNDTLDLDGRRFIQQMRIAARSPRLLRWAASKAEMAARGMSGFVWEQDGVVVGNLSLIPMTKHRRIYLIANVAVHPDYRRQGMARQLTAAALEAVLRTGGPEVWLHVRDDNQTAIRLYTDVGFSEQTRRTTWRSTGVLAAESIPDLNIVSPRKDHWQLQKKWLAQYYPETLRWYFSLDERVLQPNIFAAIYRLLGEYRVKQWAAVSDSKELFGVVSWQHTFSSSDRLWIASNPDYIEKVVAGLIPSVRRKMPRLRPLTVELPADVAAEALKKIGFEKQQTLIWMKYSM